MGSSERWAWKKEITSFTAMATMEIASVGINTVYKAASSKGLSFFVFIAYSYIIGALSLAPLPFIFPSRREALPPFFRHSTLSLIFLSATLGSLCNVCTFKGVEYSSPTLSSAVGNLAPAITFILAVIFRMEKFEWRSSTSQIKVLGTILSISGALVAVLYRGPAVITSSPDSVVLNENKASQTRWIIGGVILVSRSVFSSFWYILQGQVMKIYPDERVVSLVYFLFKTITALPICLVAEANSSSDWKLRPDIALVAIVFAGLFGPSFNTFVVTWVIHFKGPLYIAIFQPFNIAIAATLGVIFLGETLCLGSLVGATIILLGFYIVIWSKAQEDQENKNYSDEKTPLLPSCSVSTEEYVENK